MHVLPSISNFCAHGECIKNSTTNAFAEMNIFLRGFREPKIRASVLRSQKYDKKSYSSEILKFAAVDEILVLEVEQRGIFPLELHFEILNNWT